MKLPDVWPRATAVFDDGNLVSFAGLAPVMVLAEHAGKHVAKELDVKPSDIDAAVREAADEMS